MTVRIVKKYNLENQKPLTLKQQKVVSLICGNVGKIGSKAEILRQAGYSASVVNNPDHVFNSKPIKQALNTTIQKMWSISEKVLTALENKSFEKESAYNLAMISSIMTRSLELLEGRPTDRVEFELPAEEKTRLDRLLEMNRRK